MGSAADQDRIKREQDFHNKRFGQSDSPRASAWKFYAVMADVKTRFKSIISEKCPGKRLLEYGCATGGSTFSWVRLGAEVVGIDISDEAVRRACAKADKEGLLVQFKVMNAEALEFPDNYFDLVVGTGILHHLDLHKSYAELSRVVNESGFALFIEPMGHNPFINFYRWITPGMRTVDEHPFKMKDIELARDYFGSVEAEHYNFLTLLTIPFRNWKSYWKILKIANRIDQVLFKTLPFTKRYSWMVILKLSEPRRSEKGYL